MAEEAAAAYIAYEAVETVAQVGVGAYMVAKPTMPLKAKLTQIATATDDNTRLSLARSEHTLSVVANKAYIFGGETASDKLASNELHVVTLESSEKPEPDYSVVPAVPKEEGGKVPAARTKHSSCAFKDYVAIYGGVDESGDIINESSTIWLFNTTQQTWETLQTTGSEPSPRTKASLFEHQDNFVLYGGYNSQGHALNDTWHLDFTNKTWTQLPDAPVPTPNAVLSDAVLYLISGADNMGGILHYLPLTAKSEEGQSWDTVPFPSNPLTPGPLPRTEAGLLPVSTGYGRQYLLYLFGAQTANASQPDVAAEAASPDTQFRSDMWVYQLPSSQPEMKATTDIYEAIKPAKIKDVIRGALGMDSGKHSWSEVEILPPPADLDVPAGKVHPGPRSSFACGTMQDKRSVVIWGGVNPKGEREGDGWVIRLE